MYLPTFGTEQFTRCGDRADLRLVTEASDLTAGHRAPLFGQVYEDACDEGFTLVSQRTGTAVKFAVVAVDRDREGDVQAWQLKATPEEQRRNPALRTLTVTVFND